jgi:hypothetical protein
LASAALADLALQPADRLAEIVAIRAPTHDGSVTVRRPHVPEPIVGIADETEVMAARKNGRWRERLVVASLCVPTFQKDEGVEREELGVSDSHCTHTVEIPTVGQFIHEDRLPTLDS